jgi:hypothetical protein
MDQSAAAADLFPEVIEFLTHETRSEMHKKCRPSRDIDDKSVYAKLDDDQRREALVLSWWWMVNL